MIIEAHLDSMAARVSALRSQTIPALCTLSAETMAISSASVPAAGESADLNVFSTRLSGYASEQLPAVTRAVESFADGLDAARNNYAQAQEAAITRALLL
ncbi:MAG: hypothetical protein ACI4OY_14095 [Aristaeellaceae bacterium]